MQEKTLMNKPISQVAVAIDNLFERAQRAHNLYSDLHSKISYVLTSVPHEEKNSKNDSLRPASSELIAQLFSLERLIEELCMRIEADLSDIDL